ncbi:MAG: DNA primase regulatory subunit PriL [Methanobacteriota archaeon]|nr:MAG: DNA primase regulatory subunit PriL [Euryarchaeota archaeon]
MLLPFTTEAAKHLSTLGFTLENVPSNVVELGKRRVLEAVEKGVVTYPSDEEQNLLSYAAARMLISLADKPSLTRKYAIAEAKAAANTLTKLDENKIVKTAENLGLTLLQQKTSVGGRPYPLRIHFTDYLRYTEHIRGPPWKLVNRILTNGYVLITKQEAARIVSEALRLHIISSTKKWSKNIPKQCLEAVKEIKKRIKPFKQVDMATLRGFDPSALPPCIKKILSDLKMGENVPHQARFALTSFLANIGFSTNQIVELFSTLPDFKESLTRYQVEHISGVTTGKKYSPPSCGTMKTHGLCYQPEKTCEKIKHPLRFYEIEKVRKSGDKDGKPS